MKCLKNGSEDSLLGKDSWNCTIQLKLLIENCVYHIFKESKCTPSAMKMLIHREKMLVGLLGNACVWFENVHQLTLCGKIATFNKYIFLLEKVLTCISKI